MIFQIHGGRNIPHKTCFSIYTFALKCNVTLRNLGKISEMYLTKWLKMQHLVIQKYGCICAKVAQGIHYTVVVLK